MIQRAEDLERNLWIASQKYVNGDITLEDLEAMEQVQSEKLGRAVLALSKQILRKRLLSKLHGLFNISRVQSIVLGDFRK